MLRSRDASALAAREDERLGRSESARHAASELGQQEFTYTPADFDRVRGLLHAHSGITLGESKRSMVYNRLVKRLRSRGLHSFEHYLDVVESDAPEWEACLNALTTNLTAFYREAHHFEALTEYVRRRNYPKLRVWCAASSTGEEPYTLAMTLMEAYQSERPPVEIIASDIDTDVLGRAENGVYSLDRLADISDGRRSRFFLRGEGANDGFARVRKEVRNLVDFRHINLQDTNWDLPSSVDVIMCRNVLIYFDATAQQRILRRFAALIIADGLLITGHSENIFHAADIFTPLGNTVYRPTVRSLVTA